MRRFLASAVFFILFLGLTIGQQANGNAEPADSDFEKISQEAERNRELLEIWKEHVKSLTKERDQAYQELERLKASGSAVPAAQFGGIESAPLPNAAQVAQIKNLQIENEKLQSELQKRSPSSGAGNGVNRELQMQLSALQTQFQQLKKDLSDTKADKEKALQEKEKALSRMERAQSEAKNERPAAPAKLDNSLALQKQVEALTDENNHLKGDLKESIAYSGSAVDHNSEVFMRQAKALQYENDSLKAQIEKMKVVEKELASTRNYFSPIVKDLQDKNDKLAADNANISSESRRIREEAQQMSQQVQALSGKNQELASQLQAERSEKQDSVSQIETYKSQLQMYTADKERLKSTEDELQKAQSQYQSLQKNYTDSDKALGIKDAEFKRATARIAELEHANSDIENRQTDNLRSVEKYQAALRANTADMKNLKSNFEAYLESLVASFEDRQK